MTATRTLAAAALLAAVATPAMAQSAQEAQRQLFVCMQKANNLQLKDDKKDEFIKKCAEEPGKPVETDKKPT